MIVTVDEHGGILYACPSAMRLLEKAGLRADQCSELLPEQLDGLIERCLTKGEQHDAVERVIGGRRIRWTLAALPSEGGTVVLCIGRDVAQETALITQVQHAQRLESVGQLAAGIAHEINTPMQYVGDNVRFLQETFASIQPLLARLPAILGSLESGSSASEVADLRALIETADVGYVTEEIPRAITQTLDGVERVTTIVRAMKEFSHSGASEKKPADLNHALQTTLTVARNEYKYVADLVTDFAELPPFPCHVADLNQVFLNLLVNAAHAISDAVKGKEAARGTITVRTRLEPSAVVISIGDTGTGIPVHVRDKIFDPFFTTKDVGKGTGQGLPIARNVAEKHGGTLTFDTELGRGTTFHLRLPFPDKKEESR